MSVTYFPIWSNLYAAVRYYAIKMIKHAVILWACGNYTYREQDVYNLLSLPVKTPVCYNIQTKAIEQYFLIALQIILY